MNLPSNSLLRIGCDPEVLTEEGRSGAGALRLNDLFEEAQVFIGGCRALSILEDNSSFV